MMLFERKVTPEEVRGAEKIEYSRGDNELVVDIAQEVANWRRRERERKLHLVPANHSNGGKKEDGGEKVHGWFIV